MFRKIIADFRHYVEARHEGQSFEVRVEFGHSLENVSLDDFITAFHAEHKAQYSYDIPERIVEIVNCRLEAGRANAQTTDKENVRDGRSIIDPACAFRGK